MHFKLLEFVTTEYNNFLRGKIVQQKPCIALAEGTCAASNKDDFIIIHRNRQQWDIITMAQKFNICLFNFVLSLMCHIFAKKNLKDFFKKNRRFFFQDWFKRDVLILTNLGGRDTLGLLLVYYYLKRTVGLRVSIKSFLFLRHSWIKLFRPQVFIGIAI